MREVRKSETLNPLPYDNRELSVPDNILVRTLQHTKHEKHFLEIEELVVAYQFTAAVYPLRTESSKTGLDIVRMDYQRRIQENCTKNRNKIVGRRFYTLLIKKAFGI